MRKIALILLALAVAAPSVAAQTGAEWRRASVSGEPGHRSVIGDPEAVTRAWLRENR